MNGPEMMLSALLKLLGITPEKMAEMQNVAMNVAGLLQAIKAQNDRIEAQNAEILSLLRADESPRLLGADGSPLINGVDHSNQGT